jgi:hypothetical protein
MKISIKVDYYYYTIIFLFNSLLYNIDNIIIANTINAMGSLNGWARFSQYYY